MEENKCKQDGIDTVLDLCLNVGGYVITGVFAAVGITIYIQSKA